jgi:chromosomal replication initiation ATPase DnaA
MTPQLALPFAVAPALGAQDFIAAPCNRQALDFIRRWPDWPARTAALFGPAGCGKTHLATIWQAEAGASRLTMDELQRGLPEAGAPLILEDVDRSEPSEARDAALMALFERPGGALLLTGRTPPAEWPVVLADLRSRLAALLGFALWAPDDALLSALIGKHFADRQLSVPAPVIGRIVTQLERTPQAVAEFVGRADQRALAEKRPVTERLIVQLLEASERVGQTGSW